MHVIRLDRVEADDVLAYLCQRFDQDQKIIASGDKDFFQMLNEKTIIYCPSKKILKTKLDCVSEFGVHPNNFALAKALTGDKSDNIKGISGLGFKTLVKLFPTFKDEQKIKLSEVFDLCAKKENESPKFPSILSQKDLVILNFDLVQLENTIMGIQNIERIKNVLDQEVSFTQTALRLKLLHDGLLSIGQSFFDTMLSLSCRVPKR
ncbi:MAG: hypothetical protein A2Y41_14080 [Spirochaetes bacterium GWB1_36_13]|nr:MAG: hypothetical protein A2Y41_14080 [Spirochaetes bacterium GWB1_36_13]